MALKGNYKIEKMKLYSLEIRLTARLCGAVSFSSLLHANLDFQVNHGYPPMGVHLSPHEKEISFGPLP